MAMNKARRTANLNNILTYDTLGNSTLIANLTVEGLTGAGFVKADAAGLLSVDTAAYTVVTGATNYLTKITAPNTLGQSLVYDNGTSVYINTAVGVPGYSHAFQVMANGAGGLVVSTTDVASAIGIVNSSSANKTWDISPYGNHLVINESSIATRMKFDAGGNITIGDITNTGHKLEVVGSFRTTGTNTLSALQGVGDRMVVANTNGVLTTQPIPTGSITGTGAAGQVNFWTGTTTVSGSNNLFWDNANGRLGIGTNAPAAKVDINLGTGSNTNSVYIRNTSSTGYSSVTLFDNRNNNSFVGQWGLYGDAFSGNASNMFFYNSAGGGIGFYVGNGSNPSADLRLIIGNNGNIGIGTGTTVPAVRLQVSGDTLLRGSGNTSATTALTVQNSSSQNAFRLRNDGNILFGNNALPISAFTYSSVYDTIDINGTNLSIYPLSGSISLGGATQAPTTGSANNVITKGRFQPTSGTATFADIRCEPLINQTGGANGITRGLYVNPTLTAAADWRSIEFSNNTGWGLYGIGSAPNYLAGTLRVDGTVSTLSSLGIGTNTPARLLEITTSTGGEQILARFRGGNAGSNAAIEFMSGATIVGQIVGLNAFSGLTTAGIAFRYGTTEGMRLTGNGNLHIGTFVSDGGQRLQVSGDARIFLGANAGANPNLLVETTNGDSSVLRVQNSEGSFALTANNGIGNVTDGTTAISMQSGIAGIRIGSGSGGFGSGNSMLYVTGSKTSSSLAGRGIFTDATLVASANNDVLVGVDISPTFTNGAFTGVTNYAIRTSGDTLLRGSGNTSATTALTVQDSASSDMLRVRSDSRILIGGASTTAAPSIYAYSGITGNRSLRVGIQSAGSLTPIPAFNINQENDYTYTTGTGEFTTITANFLPTSGTGTLAYLSLKGTINQTGGANGITRGLYVNPTLTAAADWRSIEWSNNSGWGLYGAGTANNYLGGSLGVGVSPSYRLQIAPSATYTAINTGDGLSIYNPTLSGANLFLGVNGTGTSQGALIQGRSGLNSTYQIQLQPYGGNVGIGINPSHRLDVDGNIGISGTIYAGKSGDFNLLYDWQGNIGIWVGNNTSAYNQYSNNSHFFTNKSGATSYATFDSTGARIYGKVVAGTDSATNGSIILQDSYTNGNLTNIGTSFSSGAPVIGFGVTPSTSAIDAFVSSTPITAYPRGAFVVSDSLKYFSTTSATAAVGSAVTLTKRLELFNTGNLVIGGGADDGTNRLQVVGNIKSTGILRSDITQTATASSVSISLLGSNITNYAAGFSMVNLGYGLNAMYAQHEQRFGGNATFAHGNINGAGLLVNKIAPTAAGTVTITQQAGRLRTMSNLHLMTQFDGNNNLTVTDMSGLHIYGHYRTSGTGTLTVSNAYYGVFLADPNEFGTGATITGSNYGFYQQGTAPFNHFGGKVIIGTTATDGTSKLRISGLPTSSAGLLTGEVWNNGGVLTIV